MMKTWLKKNCGQEKQERNRIQNMNINENFLELEDNYLFSTIAKKVANYQKNNPDKNTKDVRKKTIIIKIIISFFFICTPF